MKLIMQRLMVLGNSCSSVICSAAPSAPYVSKKSLSVIVLGQRDEDSKTRRNKEFALCGFEGHRLLRGRCQERIARVGSQSDRVSES